MKLNIKVLLPICAALLVAAIVAFNSAPSPGPSADNASGQKSATPSGSDAGPEKRSSQRAGSSTTDAKTASTGDSPTPGASTPSQKTTTAVWTQLFKRHAEGDPEAIEELIKSITWSNAMSVWAVARNTKLDPAVRHRLYEALGRIGGEPLIKQLFDASDPDAPLAFQGWGQTEPKRALEWFQQLDLRGNRNMEQYLSSSNLVPEGFLDKVSGRLLDSLLPAPEKGAPDAARDAYVSEAFKLVESLSGEDTRKSEAMMREVTQRMLKLYGPEALGEWVNALENPLIKSAAVQHMIEADAFKDAPLAAADWAFSLDDPKIRGNALSAAYAKFGAGVGAVDSDKVADALSAMPKSRDRDFAINGFANGLVGRDPQGALEWAGAISDESFRNLVTNNITRKIKANEEQRRTTGK